MEMRIGSVFNSILCAYGCEFCRLSLDVVLNQYSSNLIIVIRTKPFFYWENSKSGSIGGYVNPILSLFLPIFCDFLSFSSVFLIGIMLYLVYNYFRVF